MAYASGYTYMDGEPCPPITDSYGGLIFLSFFLGSIVGLSLTTVSLLVFKMQEPSTFYITLGLATLTMWVVIGTYNVRDEMRTRKEAFEKYEKKLAVYQNQKNLVVNNGGHWPTPQEAYNKAFGIDK